MGLMRCKLPPFFFQRLTTHSTGGHCQSNSTSLLYYPNKWLPLCPNLAGISGLTKMNWCLFWKIRIPALCLHACWICWRFVFLNLKVYGLALYPDSMRLRMTTSRPGESLTVFTEVNNNEQCRTCRPGLEPRRVGSSVSGRLRWEVVLDVQILTINSLSCRTSEIQKPSKRSHTNIGQVVECREQLERS